MIKKLLSPLRSCCLLLLITTLMLACQALAEEAGAAPTVATNTGNPGPQIWQDIIKSTGAMITAATSFVLLIVGLIVAVTKLLQAWKDLQKEREFFAGGILRSNPQALTEKKQGTDYQIVLLGDGNTGKTTFVRMLSQNPKADLYSKTGASQTYGFSLTSYEPGNWESIRFLVDDYAGQTPGAIAASPSLEGVSSEQPRAGAALFMLDICPTEIGTGEIKAGWRLNNAQTFSPARLDEHMEIWSDAGLSHLQAHLRGRVRFNFVCCFINKLDLAKQWTEVEETAIKAKLEPMFDAIKRHPLFNTCRFEVIFGTLGVNERLDGPHRRQRLSVGCNLPLLWNLLVERARLSALPG